MPAIYATAPGKAILFGEHAVVYGQPAIAVPILQVKAKAVVTPLIGGDRGRVIIDAPDIGVHADLEELPPSHPLRSNIENTLRALAVDQPPALNIRITSSVPVASGLGSGAAVSVATVRALSDFLGRPLSTEQVSALAFEVEKIHHGTPSGIDNSVIAYAKPIYYIRNQAIQPLKVPVAFTLIIGDTGIPSPTVQTVGQVRDAWKKETARYEALFNQMGRIAGQARQSIENGRPEELGRLMNDNQTILEQIGVSSPELERLILAAREAGAAGAKLSGGGGGGNMIAIASPDRVSTIQTALEHAGAVRVIVSEVRNAANPTGLSE